MKKKIAFLVVFFLAGLYSSSHAFVEINKDKMNFYTAAKLGYSGLIFTDVKNTLSQKEYDRYSPTFAMAIALGVEYKMTKEFFLRLELEYAYRTEGNAKIDDLYMNAGSIESGSIAVLSELQTVLTQVYFDWYIKPQFALYTNLGFGISLLKLGVETPVTGYTNLASDFAWSAGVGFLYRITNNLVLDTAIRYMGYSTTTLGVGISNSGLSAVRIPPFGGVDVLVGIRYNF